MIVWNSVFTRLSWLLVCLVVGNPLWALATDESSSAAKRQQPNIVFIFSDDHAYQAMGCYGSKINSTPQLDRLAKTGMRFDRCLVTNSICGPSRATILTGKYSHLNGFRQNGNKFNGEQVTFPKLLQGAGYQTAIVGKWHLETLPTGFDKWMILPGQGSYYNPDFITPDGKIQLPGYTTELITEHSINWLKSERDSTKPFVLMMQHKAPHREWAPSAKHINQFRGEMVPEPATLFDDYQNRASVLAENTMSIAKDLRPEMDLRIWKPGEVGPVFQKQFLDRLTPEQKTLFEEAYAAENEVYLTDLPQADERTRYFYQRYIKDYLRCISSVDDSVGQMLDYLDESGLAENTIVIYSSDQGFYLGEHGWYDKRWIFEESLRTPLLVRWPGVTPPESGNSQIVSNLDFAQTFLEIAGVDAPQDMQGRSLVPLLQGKTPADWRTAFYYHYYELGTHNVAAHEGVVTDRYKLIHYYRRLDESNQPQEIDLWDLMDREVDPLEMRSFINDPAYETAKQELEAELVRLRTEFQVED